MKMHLIPIVTAFALTVSRTSGQGVFIYDQQSSVDGGYLEGGISGIQAAQPLGQSFTPSLDLVGFVRLSLYDSGFQNQLPGTLYVNLWEGSVTSAILASTEPVTLPPGAARLADFLFSSPVPVIPGQMYYFQPVVQSGTRWGSSLDRYNYAGGTAFIGGTAVPNFDFRFREGIIVPEPSSVTLLLLGAGGLAWVGQRRR